MHLAILSCWALVVLVFLAKSDSFLTQNAFYHARLASCLWRDGCQIALAHSRFADRFLDQHFGFHFWLGGMQQLLPAEVASKLLTTLLVFLLGWLIIREGHPRARLAHALIFGAMFFLLFDSFARLLWGRPQLLGLVAVLLLWRMTQKRVSPVILTGLSLISALVSFETLILILGLSWTLGLADRAQRGAALALSLGALASLFVFPIGFDKIHYLGHLLAENLSNVGGIREWEPTTRPPYILISGWLGFLWLRRRAAFRDRVWLGLSLASLILTLFAVRFEYLSATFLVIGLVRSEVLVQSPARRWILPAVILTGAISAYWHLRNFTADRTVFDARPVTRWLARHRPGEAVLNWRWEYWSSLIYADPNLTSAPGFSPLLYRAENWFEAFLRLRGPETTPQPRDLRIALRALNSRLVLLDHASGASAKFRALNWPVTEIYMGPQFSVFEYWPNRGAEPKQRPLFTAEFRSQILDTLSTALGWDWRDIYYDVRPSRDPENVQRARRLVGVLAFCKLAPRSEQCRSLLHSIRSLDRSGWDLGSLSIWGMILTEVPVGAEFSSIRQQTLAQVQGFFDPQARRWRLRPGPGSHFQIGEALTLLAAHFDFKELAWLESEIQDYARQFRLTQDYLRVRWLLGLMSYARAHHPKAAWIEAEIDSVFWWLNTRQNPQGCLTDPDRSVPIHISGLMLEGLSYLSTISDPRVDSLVAGFQHCAFSEAPAEMFDRGYQIDILGHVGNAVANSNSSP